MKRLSTEISIDKNSPFDRVKSYDLSPGKVHLSERELEKLALQGIFDFPHNKINNQLLENIDLKEADKRYYDKFKAQQKNASQVQSETKLPSTYNRFKREVIAQNMTNGINLNREHHRSQIDLDPKAIDFDEVKEKKIDQIDENPYVDQKLEDEPIIKQSKPSSRQNEAEAYSRNQYQNLNQVQQNRGSTVRI